MDRSADLSTPRQQLMETVEKFFILRDAVLPMARGNMDKLLKVLTLHFRAVRH